MAMPMYFSVALRKLDRTFAKGFTGMTSHAYREPFTECLLPVARPIMFALGSSYWQPRVFWILHNYR